MRCVRCVRAGAAAQRCGGGTAAARRRGWGDTTTRRRDGGAVRRCGRRRGAHLRKVHVGVAHDLEVVLLGGVAQEARHLRELVLHLEEDDALAGARARLGGVLPPVVRERGAHQVQHDDRVLAPVEGGDHLVLAVEAERLREHAQALLQPSAQRRVLRRGDLHHRFVERQVVVGRGAGHGGGGAGCRRHGSRAVRHAQQ